jgi:hypothetical protein
MPSSWKHDHRTDSRQRVLRVRVDELGAPRKGQLRLPTVLFPIMENHKRHSHLATRSRATQDLLLCF